MDNPKRDYIIQGGAEGFHITKLDLALAYRSVKVKPSNFVATGLKWTFSGDYVPTYMVDTRLPFGAKSSCEIFNELGQAVRGMMRGRGYPSIVNYLDDYIIIGDSYSACRTMLATLMRLLRTSGFAINYNKVEAQCRHILLDTVAMSMELLDRTEGVATESQHVEKAEQAAVAISGRETELGVTVCTRRAYIHATYNRRNTSPTCTMASGESNESIGSGHCIVASF